MKYTSLLLIGIALMLSSCAHYYYVATPKNVPLFKEKNEYRANLALGFQGFEVGTVDIQAAYSITDHIAVSANYLNARGGNKSSGDWGAGNYYDVAVGYYKPINNRYIFEVFGGVGTSKQYHQYDENRGVSDLSFTSYFVQPSIGYSLKHFEIALSTTLSHLRFGTINVASVNSNMEPRLINILTNRNSMLFEPCLTIRGGFDYVKIQMQGMTTSNLSHSNQWTQQFRLSMGLQFAFAERFLNKQTKN